MRRLCRRVFDFIQRHPKMHFSNRKPFCAGVELPSNCRRFCRGFCHRVCRGCCRGFCRHHFYPPPSGQIFDQITTFRDIFAQILTFRDIFVRFVFTQILTFRGTSEEKKCPKSLRFATYSRHIRSFCLFKSLRYAAPPKHNIRNMSRNLGIWYIFCT